MFYAESIFLCKAEEGGAAVAASTDGNTTDGNLGK